MENFLEACIATSKRKGEVTSCDKQLWEAGRHGHNLQQEAKAQLLEHCRVLATPLPPRTSRTSTVCSPTLKIASEQNHKRKYQVLFFGSANILHHLVHPPHVNFWMAWEIFQALADCKLGSKRRVVLTFPGPRAQHLSRAPGSLWQRTGDHTHNVHNSVWAAAQSQQSPCSKH